MSFSGFFIIIVSLYRLLVVLVDFIGDDLPILTYGADGVLLVVLAFVHGDFVPVFIA